MDSRQTGRRVRSAGTPTALGYWKSGPLLCARLTDVQCLRKSRAPAGRRGGGKCAWSWGCSGLGGLGATCGCSFRPRSSAFSHRKAILTRTGRMNSSARELGAQDYIRPASTAIVADELQKARADRGARRDPGDHAGPERAPRFDHASSTGSVLWKRSAFVGRGRREGDRPGSRCEPLLQRHRRAPGAPFAGDGPRAEQPERLEGTTDSSQARLTGGKKADEFGRFSPGGPPRAKAIRRMHGDNEVRVSAPFGLDMSEGARDPVDRGTHGLPTRTSPFLPAAGSRSAFRQRA